MMDDDGTDPFGSPGDGGTQVIEPVGVIDGERIEDLNARWAATYGTND